MPDLSVLLESPPRGWAPARFCDICARVQDAASPSVDGKRLYLGLEHLSSGFPALVGRGMESDVRSGKTSFRSRDVLFGKLRPYLRKSVLVGEDGICSTDILVFRATEKCIPEFLCLLTHTDEFIGHAKATTSGVQHPRTSWSGLQEFKLHIPPVREQRKIAGVLGVVQRAMEQQERLLVLTAELKKALLHQLFTTGLRGEPQKQTEIGLVPESWEVVKLGSVANFQTGKLNSNAAKHDGKFPFFTCSQETFWIDYYAFDTEAILLSGNNARGIYSVKHFKGKFNAYQRTYVITLKNSASFPYFFLHQALSRNLDRLRMLSIGTSTKYLTMGVLQNLSIPMPGYDEAKRIGETLQLFEKKLQLVAKKRALLSELFRTLLHQLMTAQLRVYDLDMAELETITQG